MHAGLVNAPMNGSDIFTAPAALYAFHVAVVRVPVAVQLMQTRGIIYGVTHGPRRGLARLLADLAPEILPAATRDGRAA